MEEENELYTRVHTYILHACVNSYSDSGVYILTWTAPPPSCGRVGRGGRRCFYLVLFRVTWLYFLLCFLSKTVTWKNVVKFVAALCLVSLPAPPQSPGKLCVPNIIRGEAWGLLMEDLAHWAHPLQPDCLGCHKNRDVEKLQGQEEPFCWFSSSAFPYVFDLR